jgi:hypothetical protein
MPRLLRCFDARFFRSVLLATAAMLLFVWIGKRYPRGSTMRILLSLCTSASFAYVIAISVGSVRRLDELGQRIHLIAIAVAFAVTGIVLTAATIIESAGGPRLEPDFGWWPVMTLVWAAGVIVLSRRYR